MADRVGQQLGHYRLLRKLGQGAFAEVYLGEHLYLERLAAIKVLHVQMDPKRQEQFRHEARTIARLDHPHIVRVLDFGIEGQTPYLVMEYTPGGSLQSQHPKGKGLSFEQIVSYVKQIASALDYAHQQRVIHRDVKPDNLLLNAKGEIVLSDFGLAVIQHTLDSLSTQNPAGTPLYMAPEQIQRKPYAASDQYALGIIVYEWLAGAAPFHGGLFEVFSHHLSQPPPSLCERLPDLPTAVEEAVFRALAKDPAYRFASVTDFALALEEASDATQPLTLPGLPKQWTSEPTGSSRTLFVPLSGASEQEHSSSSTQPVFMAVQGTERGEEMVPARAPEPSRYGLPDFKPSKPSLAQTNRQRLLRKVRAFWITGVLEHSLHGASLIALGLQEQPDALAHPWHLVLQHPDTPPHAFPTGTRITDVYDAANGELLILGAPGSGKTTLLLELTCELLNRAEQDEHHPLPVVLNLSSWAIKQQPLADWLVEELNRTYQVPRPLGQTLVETEQILLLLDGLDEVALKERTACIESINRYREEHGLLPLVVCSRSADYLAQSARIRLGSAVTVQPLTQQQVDDYLTRGGEALWALRVALHQDAALRELAQTPLMLSILTLTYHDLPVEGLLQGGMAPTRQQVFDHYTQRMLKHRGVQRGYTPKQTIHWLSHLAGQMKRRSQTVFYLEQMQPTWLSGHRRHGVYDWLAVRAPGVLMGVLVSLLISVFVGGSLTILPSIPIILLGGFLGGLLSTEHIPQRPAGGSGKAGSALALRLLRWLLMGALIGLGSGLSVGLRAGRLGGLSYGLSYGLSIGLSVGLCSILLQFLLRKNDTGEARSQAPPPARGTRWQRLIRRREIHNGLLVGLLVGLSFGLSVGLNDGLLYGLSDALLYGLLYGLSAGVLSVLLLGRSTAVHPTDLLVWSWRSLGKSLFSKSHASRTMQVTVLIGLSFGLSFGLSNGVIFGISVGLSEVLRAGLIFGLSIGLSVGLSYWLLLGLFQGVSSTTIEDQRRVAPNQGIHRSALNGLVFGLISAVIVGLGNALIYALSFGLLVRLLGGVGDVLSFLLSSGLQTGLQAGLLAGLLVGLLYGGLASFRHYVVRFLLWRTGSLPWNYSRFLDYAAERVLLSKVGGGYIFIHRLLLEYFASLDTPLTPDAAKAKKEQAESA